MSRGRNFAAYSIPMRAAWARIKRGEGRLYTAISSDRKTIKIGFALDPEKRVRSLRGIRGGRFRLVATAAGTYREERFLHGKLKEHRIGGIEYYEQSVLSHPALPAEFRPAPKPRKRAA